MNELWRGISGYEDLYEVSSSGHIRNSISGNLLVPEITEDGYLRVSLRKDGVNTKYSIGRLVADVFVDNSDSLPVVLRIDGDRLNNSATNLVWGTQLDVKDLHLAKSYWIKDPLGSIFKVHNLCKFCRKNNLHRGAMGEMATGLIRKGRSPRAHHKGYVCKFKLEELI